MLKFRRSFSPEKSYNSRGWIQIHNYKRTILRKHFTQNFSFDDQIYFSSNSPAVASAWPGCAAHWSLHGTVGGIYYFCFVEKYLCIKIFVTSADFKLQKWFLHPNGVEWSAMVMCTGTGHWCVLRLVMCDGPRWCRPRPRLTSPNNYPSPQSAPSPPAWLLLSCRGPRRSRRARRGTVASRGDAVAWWAANLLILADFLPSTSL